MSEKKEKSYLDYDFNLFLRQMGRATQVLKEINEAATYMRWQYPQDEVMKEFEKEIDIASGWLSSWCG